MKLVSKPPVKCFSRYRPVNGYRGICTLMPPLARQQCACKKKQGHLQRRTKSPHLKRRSLLCDHEDTLEGVPPPFCVLEALTLCFNCFIEILIHALVICSIPLKQACTT